METVTVTSDITLPPSVMDEVTARYAIKIKTYLLKELPILNKVPFLDRWINKILRLVVVKVSGIFNVGKKDWRGHIYSPAIAPFMSTSFKGQYQYIWRIVEDGATMLYRVEPDKYNVANQTLVFIGENKVGWKIAPTSNDTVIPIPNYTTAYRYVKADLHGQGVTMPPFDVAYKAFRQGALMSKEGATIVEATDKEVREIGKAIEEKQTKAIINGILLGVIALSIGSVVYLLVKPSKGVMASVARGAV
jgi:hypothetical protein